MTTRRSFFKQAGLGLAAAAGTPALITAAAHAQAAAPAAAPFKIAIAGFTFHKFKLDKEAALADAQKKNPQATLKDVPDQTLEMLKLLPVAPSTLSPFFLH